MRRATMVARISSARGGPAGDRAGDRDGRDRPMSLRATRTRPLLVLPLAAFKVAQAMLVNLGDPGQGADGGPGRGDRDGRDRPMSLRATRTRPVLFLPLAAFKVAPAMLVNLGDPGQGADVFCVFFDGRQQIVYPLPNPILGRLGYGDR